MFGGSFGKNLDILAREMDVSILRRSVIANNIANSDTPNFKRSEVTFESQLKRALDSEKVVPFPQYITNERHIAFDKPMDYRQVKAQRLLDYLTESKNNGNNVDIEQEGMNSLQNELLYTTLAQVISAEIGRVNVVLR